MSSYVRQRASDKVSVQDGLQPQTGEGTFNTGWIGAKVACNFLALISANVVGTSLDAKIEQAEDNAGLNAKDVTDKAITQLTAEGTALIDVNHDDLDAENGFDFIRISVTTVGATTDFCAFLLALDPGYEPLAQGALVDEVVQ